MYKRGAFATVTLVEFPDYDNTRQGILISENQILLEDDRQFKIDKIYAIVPDENLLPDTLKYVKEWRVNNL